MWYNKAYLEVMLVKVAKSNGKEVLCKWRKFYAKYFNYRR